MEGEGLPEAEAQTSRWKEMVDVVSGGLTLDSLLRAQERVTEAEYEFARAQLTYNLALIGHRFSSPAAGDARPGAGWTPGAARR